MQLNIMIPTHIAHCEYVHGNEKFVEEVPVQATSAAEAVRQVRLDERRIRVRAIEKLGAPFTVTPIA